MKKLKFTIAFAVVCGLSFSNLQAQQIAKITPSGIGYLEYLPQGYSGNTNDYPIVISLHGIGERGTTSTDPTTIKNSVLTVTNAGLPRYVKNGTQYPFILISPQLKTSYGTWPATYVMDVLNYVKTYLRINDKRIYITGLSLGGFGTWTTIGAYPDVFAAAVPICSGGNALSKACVIASANIPLWAFHGTSDNIVSYTVTTVMVNAINACTPKPSPLAKTTLYSGLTHNIWDKVYLESGAINWMLGFIDGTTDPVAPNIPPVVNAGSDKSLTLPTNEVYVQGTASDSDGSISSYQWTKISGGTASMTGTTGSRLRAYNLLTGSYSFRLAVADDKGATKYDDVNVTVSPALIVNIAPVANAGSDKFISSNSITLSGSGTDQDGQVVSYNWTKYHGGPVTLTNANTRNVTVSGMVNGKYFLRLVVTDDKGATAYDNMQIEVTGAASSSQTSTTNIAPVANAGSDIPTTASSITLHGSGTDKDGQIVSYKWIKYHGGPVTLTNANSKDVSVSGMTTGKYFFQLIVTDDRGGTDYDNMQIIVGGG
jgi:predicted esterase